MSDDFIIPESKYEKFRKKLRSYKLEEKKLSIGGGKVKEEKKKKKKTTNSGFKTGIKIKLPRAPPII